MNENDILPICDFPLSAKQVEAFDTYYRLLVEWNDKFNLTAIIDKAEVYSKHFADSLAGAKYMKGAVCDVGAGAGFPSLPLAIAGVAHSYTLLDAVNKKVMFLQTVAGQLQLSTVTALHMRAEEAGRGKLRETFDTVTARAVAPIATLLEYLSPLAKVGGRVVVYKTDADKELAACAKACATLGLRIADVHTYTVGDAARCLLVFDKIAPCPKGYPRLGNKPRTNPIQ